MSVPRRRDELVAAALENADVFSAAGAFSVAQSDAKQVKALAQLLLAKRRDVLRLARWEHTPAKVLQAIADYAGNDQMMQTRLVRNQNTPMLSEVLERTVQLDRSLLGLVAQHTQVPRALLMQLARDDQDVMLLKSIARNTAADAEVLEVLLKREPLKLASEVVANPATTRQMLEVLYQTGNAYVKAAVIGHPNFTGVDLAIGLTVDLSKVQADAGLAHKKNATPNLKPSPAQLLLQRQLAKLALPQALLSMMAQSEDSAVRVAVAANPVFVGAQSMLNDHAPAVRRALAAREDLSINQMQALSLDQDVWVRVWLARNPAIDRNTMLYLAEDVEDEVRRGVARNTRCPLAFLEKFVNDVSAWVRAAVAYQANVSADLLVQLAKDQDVDILSGVASNSHTPKAILQNLAGHAEADIRRGVILNKMADRETLLPILQDPYYLHRMMLVWNKQLTEEDKWSLHDDPDENVRFAVFKWFGERIMSAQQAQHLQDDEKVITRVH